VQYYVTNDIDQLGKKLDAATPVDAARAAIPALSARTGDRVLVRWDVRPDPKARGQWLSARGMEIAIAADWGAPAAAPEEKPPVKEEPKAEAAPPLKEEPKAEAAPPAKEEQPKAEAAPPAKEEHPKAEETPAKEKPRGKKQGKAD